MVTEMMNQIMDISATLQTDKQYRCLWEEYQRRFAALTAFMDTMNMEQYNIVDDYIWAFFDISIQMMELALQIDQ